MVQQDKHYDFIVWPPLSSRASDDALQSFAVAAWFAGPIAKEILIPIRDTTGQRGAVPEYISAAAYFDAEKISFVSIEEAERRVREGDVTLLIRSRDVENDQVLRSAKPMIGSQKVEPHAPRADAENKYYFIGTPENDVQDAYYATCLTYWATGGEDGQFLTESRQRLLEIKALADTYESVSIFGTGPSLAEALDRDHQHSLNIICNTIVKNVEFWSAIQPKIIVASDAHFHFSYHRYSARLLSDIALFLKNTGASFFTFDKFAAFIRRRVPSIADRVFGIPAGRSEYGFDLDRDFRVFPGDSVLNMFLLPIASYLHDCVALYGFTGRAPNDNYFWGHSEAHQYTDLMDCVRAAHPAFFRDRDYSGYANTVDQEIALRVNAARASGKTVVSKTTSFYSSFR